MRRRPASELAAFRPAAERVAAFMYFGLEVVSLEIVQGKGVEGTLRPDLSSSHADRAAKAGNAMGKRLKTVQTIDVGNK